MRAQHHGMQRPVRHIFADALPARVIDTHNYHGRNLALADQPVRGFIHLPLDAIERRGGLEQVLAIIHIEHGVTPTGVCGVVIPWRQPHPQHPHVTKNAAAKFM